jgi:hypothetical protein
MLDPVYLSIKQGIQVMTKPRTFAHLPRTRPVPSQVLQPSRRVQLQALEHWQQTPETPPIRFYNKQQS